MATSELRSLVVSLEARIDKFEANMKSASDVTQRSMAGIQDSLGKAKSQFLSLAASVVSVGAAVQSVKGAIQLGDDLKQMADSTGLAVAKLDQLSIVAKLNGANLEDIAKGFKGLTKAMVESGDSTSKNAKLFQALGVAVKDSAGNLRGVDEVMGDVAKALNSIENETTRAAVGTAIFGKSYLQIAATLRNYQADQKAANDILEKFGGVSVQAANLADELGDKFTLLGEGSKRALLTGLVPGMAAVSQGIQELIDKGGGFQRSFGDVISSVAEFVTKSLVSLGGAFEVVGTTIAAVAASIATGSLQPFRDLPGEIDKIEARVKGAQARIANAAKFPGLDDSDQVSRAAGALDRLNDATSRSAISSKKLADILGEGKAKVDAYAKALDALQKSVAGADAELLALTSQSKDLVPLQKSLAEFQASDVWKQASQAFRDQYEALAKVGIATQQTTAEFKKLADASAEFAENRRKEHEDYLKQQSQVIAQTTAVVRSYEEANDTLAAEISIIGESDLAHRQLAATLEYEAQRRKIVAATTFDNVEAMDAELVKLEEQFNRRQQLIGLGVLKDQLAAARGALSDFFVDLFNNGFGSFKNLWDSFKQLAFRALADVAAKEIIVSITGALGLGAAGVAGAAQSAGGGIGGIGSLLGGVGSLFGSGSGAFSAGAGAGISAGIETIKLAATAGLESVGGIAGVLGAASTFLPIAGLAAAIAIPVFSKLFGGSAANRSATFGSGNLGSDASRDAAFSSSSAFGSFGVISDKHLNEKDVGATQAFGALLSSIKTLDNTIAGLVGGDLTKQIANALASHTVTVGLGKEKTDVGASGGPAQILKDRYVTVLTAIDAQLGAMVQSFEGTSEELASFVVSLVAVRTALGDTFKSLDTGDINALGEAFGGLDKLASGLSFLSANFHAAVDAQQQLVDSFGAIGVAVPQTHQAFLDLLSSFDLTTDSGRALYASVLNLSGAFVEVNGTATQAAAALRQSFASLDAARNSFNQVPQAQQQEQQLLSLIDRLNIGTGNPDFTRLLQQAGPLGYAQNLATISHDDFATYSAANQSLITEILNLAAQIRSTPAPTTPTQYDFYQQPTAPVAGAAGPMPEDIAADWMRQYAELANQSTGNYAEKLALQIKQITFAIGYAVSHDMPQVAAILQKSNSDFAASIALFNNLSDRYTDDIAEQLVKLTEWYNQQATSMSASQERLDVLNIVFEEQWTAIINGTAAGVDGTLDQLRKLQQGLLDYVDSLKISADSPLTATQRLAEARNQYEADLAKARTGDQSALQEISNSFEAYRKLARDFYASSSTYTDIFNAGVAQLTELGNMNFGGAAPIGASYQPMSAADMQDAALYMQGAATPGATTWQQQWETARARTDVPTPIVDAAVADKLGATISEAIYEAMLMLARSNTDDADAVKTEVDRAKNAIVEAITVGLK